MAGMTCNTCKFFKADDGPHESGGDTWGDCICMPPEKIKSRNAIYRRSIGSAKCGQWKSGHDGGNSVVVNIGAKVADSLVTGGIADAVRNVWASKGVTTQIETYVDDEGSVTLVFATGKSLPELKSGEEEEGPTETS